MSLAASPSGVVVSENRRCAIGTGMPSWGPAACLMICACPVGTISGRMRWRGIWLNAPLRRVVGGVGVLCATQSVCAMTFVEASVVWLLAAMLREPWVSFSTMTRVVSRLEFPELPSARGGDLREVVPALLISPTADWPSR